MTDALLGVTTCPTCKNRFRVPKKYESFVGKEIKCPKCKRPFVIKLETAAPIELAAISATSSQTGDSSSPNALAVDGQATAKPKRRTKAQVRKAAYKRIKKEFGAFLKQLETITACDSSPEERIRIWCRDVLVTALGYTVEDLDFEVSAGKGKIDIAIKHEGNVVLVIECKKPGTLPPVARKAAISYAATRSANWAAVTNGQIWELHRVIPVTGQDPQGIEIFNISLLDDDGLSTYDVERMYLLTKRALVKGETEKEFHRARCLSDERLLEALLSDKAVTAIRRTLHLSYKKAHKESVKLTNDEVYDALKALIRPDDLEGDA